jgi:ssDNA-binding Zn-finger/Zn-ribbon topoisomerase 1
MEEYITKRQLLDMADADYVFGTTGKRMIKNAPISDVQPVIHAHWSDEVGDVHSTGKFRVCSNCGKNVFIPYFSIQGINKVDFEYCPNCNATMNETTSK